MEPFHQRLLTATQPIWKGILAHPFLSAVADNSIDEAVFKTWMAQDYLFIQASVPFLGVLLAKAPVHIRPMLGQSIVGFNSELELFRQQATECGVDLTNEPTPTCHAFTQFLMATAYDRPFEVGFTVLYGGEKAYMDAWQHVKAQQQGVSPWQPFIDNWSSAAFQGYVDWIATTLDALAAEKPEHVLREMEQHFLYTARYELLFWDMAQSGEQWPG
ncbi:MAG: hypothetical protein HC837_09770 [Chloroflexaceae bacterium]|nr:hypothetical protein [Chloroflexaceae bacterium]